MHKIIVLAEPVEGHFNPFVPIIIKLVERGNDVVCITGISFKKRVESTGATFHAMPEKWDPMDKEIYDFYPELRKKKGLKQIKYYIKHVMFDPVPDILKILEDLMVNFPADLVIYDTFMIAGAWETELGGPPSIRLSVLPLSLPGKNIAPFGLGILPGNSFLTNLRNNFLNALFDKFIFRDVQKYLNDIRKTLGLAPYDKSYFVKGYEIPNLVFHTSTPSFEYPRENFPSNFRFIGPILMAPKVNYKKPDWWSEIVNGKPLILINQGTIAKNYDDLILPAIEALKDEKMTILAVPVKDNELSNLPENVYVESYIPFGNILPHVDLMITNGGFGGTQMALSHGIPVVIAGATEDKMEVASRLEKTGAGINMRRQKPTPKNIRKAVMMVLSDPSYKQKAKEIQVDFAKYDAPERAVELIDEYLKECKRKTVY